MKAKLKTYKDVLQHVSHKLKSGAIFCDGAYVYKNDKNTRCAIGWCLTDAELALIQKSEICNYTWEHLVDELPDLEHPNISIEKLQRLQDANDKGPRFLQTYLASELKACIS